MGCALRSIPFSVYSIRRTGAVEFADGVSVVAGFGLGIIRTCVWGDDMYRKGDRGFIDHGESKVGIRLPVRYLHVSNETGIFQDHCLFQFPQYKIPFGGWRRVLAREFRIKPLAFDYISSTLVCSNFSAAKQMSF